MTPAEAQPILAALDALGAQVVALRHQVLARVEQAPQRPAGAPCGHADAVLVAMRDGDAWVCGDGCAEAPA